jgi:hypothetical protein
MKLLLPLLLFVSLHSAHAQLAPKPNIRCDLREVVTNGGGIEDPTYVKLAQPTILPYPGNNARTIVDERFGAINVALRRDAQTGAFTITLQKSAANGDKFSASIPEGAMSAVKGLGAISARATFAYTQDGEDKLAIVEYICRRWK